MNLENIKIKMQNFEIIQITDKQIIAKCLSCDSISNKNINNPNNKCRCCSNRKINSEKKERKNQKLFKKYPSILSIIEIDKQYQMIEFTCSKCGKINTKNLWAFESSQICKHCNNSEASIKRNNSEISHKDRIENQIKNISSDFTIVNFKDVNSNIKIKCNHCNSMKNDKIHRVLKFARVKKSYKCHKCVKDDKIKMSAYNLVKFYENNEHLANKLGYLYMYKMVCNNSEMYKIGITRNTIQGRIYKIKDIFKISDIVYIKDTNLNVAKLERKLKSKYKDFKIKPDIKFEGYSECFTIPILFKENMQVQRLES